MCLLLSLPLVTAPAALADSAGAKNREGNKLYLQGRFADAEKAYVEAQGAAPGRPELLYNHGNALIRQKKFDPALQQLRQAASKGNRGLQASAWYNSGNALYEMGNFQEAVQAYIQALRNNPSDRDAKHNLELALKKMQRQQGGEGSRNGQPDRKGKEQPEQKQENQPQEQKEPAGSPESHRQEAGEGTDGRTPKPDRRDGSLSKDQALQILDALQNQELADQKKRLHQLERRRNPGKDW